MAYHLNTLILNTTYTSKAQLSFENVFKISIINATGQLLSSFYK